MRALPRDEEVPLYDDGAQSRDFTFCLDIVEGALAAALYLASGEVFNLGGGSRTTLIEAIRMVGEIAGKKARLKTLARQRGDVRHTNAEIARAWDKLSFSPRVA